MSNELRSRGYGNVVEEYEKILEEFVASGGNADVILNNYMNVRTISRITTALVRNRPTQEILVPDWLITSHVT